MKGDVGLKLRNHDERLRQITAVMYFTIKGIVEKSQYKYLKNKINNKTLQKNNTSKEICLITSQKRSTY